MMRVKLLFLIVILVILISFVQNKLILKQVVILNRHSLRTPLANNLNHVSPKAWPKWDQTPGVLTAKGARLAGYMGVYIAAWLKNEGILPVSCPNEDDLHVYSNSMERTLTSAESFIEKGFPNCKINVRHTGFNISNPLFNPIIHNTSATFKELAVEEISDVLNTVRVHLNEAYELLSHILEFKQSKLCEIEKKCNLAKEKHHISIIPGSRPRLSGPLKIGSDIIDAFLMQNYEGFPTEDVAWGHLTDMSSWQTIVKLNIAYFNVTYKTRLVARDISRPLIKYMSELFLKGNSKPTVTLLFGHDVNIHTVFKTLLVKPYSLENQLEIIPIGSAVIFQKWKDNENQKLFFKLSIMYQSTEQLKNCNILSLESPPQIKTLELENCDVDQNGFCSWHHFAVLLDRL